MMRGDHDACVKYWETRYVLLRSISVGRDEEGREGGRKKREGGSEGGRRGREGGRKGEIN